MNLTQTPSQVYHQVFQDVAGRPFSEIYNNLMLDKVEGGIKDFDGSTILWHPSLPQNEAVIVAFSSNQSVLLRYPDNTYHHLDVGGYFTDETTGQVYYYPEAINDDENLSLGYLKDILDDEGSFWAYGIILDEKVQERVLSGEFNSLKETLPDLK